MADKKIARVVKIDQVQPDARIIELQLEEPASIEFIGGQYVIVHTDAEIEPGKVAKGTFTIISPESATDRMILAIKQIGDGPCTTWLNQSLNEGDQLGYSGPWGAKNYETEVGDVDALFLATDTGINAAIGFLNSKKASACLSKAHVLWFVPSTEYFLAEDYVRQVIPEVVRERFRMVTIAPIGDSVRVEQALSEVEKVLQDLKPRYALLSGDGDVLEPARQLLTARGFGSSVTMEPYFNKPDPKADSKKNNFAPVSPPAPAPLPPPKPQPELS